MNRKYNLKLDLQFRCNNSIMKFNQFDNNTSDFFIKISNGGKSFDVEKAIVVLATIKPSGKVSSQFIEVKNDVIYADLKPSMKDEIGTYTAQAMLILEDERVVTDSISYKVEEDKIFSLLNDNVETTEEFTLLTDMLSRLSTIETNEEQRVINEAERILSEENRKIEEAKRVEAELIRQHEEADRAKYDATRESNENIRLANETNRIDEEAKRVEEEAKRVEAEQLRKDNYNFMTEDEERRRLEANAHKEAEKLRAQAEYTRVNEEAKRRTTEQARVSAENTRVNNENTRETNETTRQNNETHRVEAETQRQNRYNSFIADAEVNANNFENYTNTAKVKEEERKSNELDRKSQEARRVSNEVERISNENTRKANEKAREKNETSRQYVFENKVDEVDSKISELDNTKSDMATSINNKVNEVENRFNALTSKQQQDAEVIDARDGETSLKARLDRDIEKAKQVYVDVEGSHISSDSSVGYAKDVEILGNTIQDASNLADIRSVGDKIEGQELYEIPVVSCGKNLFDGNEFTPREAINQYSYIDGILTMSCDGQAYRRVDYILPNTLVHGKRYILTANVKALEYSSGYTPSQNFGYGYYNGGSSDYYGSFDASSNTAKLEFVYNEQGENVIGFHNEVKEGLTKLQWSNIQLEEGTQATPYEPYQEDKLTILSPTQLEKVGDVRDRIIEKNGVFGVEKNIETYHPNVNKIYNYLSMENSFRVSSNSVDAIITPKTSRSICNLLIEGVGSDWTLDKQCCYVLTNNTLVIKGDIRNASNLEEAREWIKSSGLYVKYPTTQPQFIPLPHSQQVKLRTFANKTNISFGCEIEGTIKAQVPKSIGATVNTHTEQINNLNKELDRVKKLEESTVSTVTTESDFTTVEATSNGYFEDVKLEGKTLVNIMGDSTQVVLGNINGNTGVEIAASAYCRTDFIQVNDSCISVLFSNFSLNYRIHKVVFYDSDKNFIKQIENNATTNTVYRISEKFSYIRVVFGKPITQTEDLDINIIKNTIKPYILEGDHTKNPPSCFEGLKSVGQSATTSEDEVDEIVVSSVKGDGNLFDGTLEVGSLNASGDTNWTPYVKTGLIRVKPSSEVVCKIGKYKGENATSTDIRMAEYDMNKNFIKFSGETHKATVSDKTHYVKFAKKLETSDTSRVDINAVSDVVVVYGNKLHDIPHQSDKKRLLYYNEETQTWEKPILREWDSIEKHADSKYYYHQRSAEVVFNGSENWGLNAGWSGEEMSTNSYYLTADSQKTAGLMIKSNGATNIISEVMPTVFINGTSFDSDCVSGENYSGAIYIRINKSKVLSGIKPYLQQNPMRVVYQLAEEKVYECTNIDLITYTNETNYVVESGVLSPRTTLKVHNNISNVVSLLQKKVSLLESNVKASQEVQDMMILETDMRMLDIELALMEFAPMKLNLGGSNMLRSATYFNFLKNHIINETYEKEYLENVMNKYLATGRINQDEYNELYKMLYPPVYDIELPIEY